MRFKEMVKVVSGILAVFAFSAHAGLIMEERFDTYPEGLKLGGKTNNASWYNGAWSGWENAATMVTNNSYKADQIAGETRDLASPISVSGAQATHSAVYTAVRLKQNISDGGGLIRIGFYNSADPDHYLFAAQVNSGKAQFMTEGDAAWGAAPTGNDTWTTLVMKWEDNGTGGSKVTCWVDPASESDDPMVTFNKDYDGGYEVARIQVNTYNNTAGVEFGYVDSVLMGESFAEVTSVSEPGLILEERFDTYPEGLKLGGKTDNAVWYNGAWSGWEAAATMVTNNSYTVDQNAGETRDLASPISVSGAQATHSAVYTAVRLKQNISDGDGLVRMGFYNSADPDHYLFAAQVNSGKAQFMTEGDAAWSPAPAPTVDNDTWTTLVMKWEDNGSGGSKVTCWVDPASELDDPMVTFNKDYDGGYEVARIQVNTANNAAGVDFGYVDSVLMGESFDEVVFVSEPPTSPEPAHLSIAYDGTNVVVGTQDLSPTASNVLQVATDLVSPSWSNVPPYSTGTSNAEWNVSSAGSGYFRILSY